jgi:hypothetical protein
MNNKKYTLTIELPPGTLYLAIALSVVYDVKLMLITLGSLTLLLTTLKQIGWLK